MTRLRAKVKAILVCFFYISTFYSQVKIGDNPTVIGTSSLLELQSSNKGLVLPRVANVSMISNPVTGMAVYDLSNNCLRIYTNGQWSDCLNPSAAYGLPGSNGTSQVLAYNCSGISKGTMTVGQSVSGVTQGITVTVASGGTYSISATANGVTFSGGGTWAAAGTYNVNLEASGTPTAAGTATFVLNTNPGCSFTRSISESFSNAVCSTSYGQFPVTVSINSQNITITKPGTNSIVNTVDQCGVSTSATKCPRIYYGQSAGYNFSSPIKNVQCYLSGVNGSQNNEGVTVTAFLNNAPVAVQLVPFAGCTEEYNATQDGLSGILKCNTDSGYDSAVVFNISSSGPYDKIVIARNSTETAGSIYLELLLCNAVLP